MPSISISVAVLLALVAFGLFAGFIGHITNMLQPSSIIASILADADGEGSPYPTGAGGEPDDPDRALAAAAAVQGAAAAVAVRSEGEGFLTTVRGAKIVACAEERGGLVAQRAPIGEYVLPGQPLAEVWAPDEEAAAGLAAETAAQFELGRQRTVPQDPGFPVRQLADVALKGLSPGINDPTTAQNAMEAMTARLVRFAQLPVASPVRVGDDGAPRFIAAAPTLDHLVRVGFEQVRVFSESDPSFQARLVELLDRLREVAAEEGISGAEAERQSTLTGMAAAGTGSDS